MTEQIRFFVPGRPATAGSKTAIRPGVIIEAGTKASRLHKRTWRGDLRDAALKATAGGPLGLAAFNCPVAATFVIVRKRPSAHVGTGRNAGVVKPWAVGLLPSERPDTLKQIRAAEDALTGYLWPDDSLLVQHSLFKAFGDQVGLSPAAEGLFVAVRAAHGYMGPQLVGLAA